MFVGRDREIERIDEILFQTKHGNPTHILIIGERGIGKSSLLLVTNYFAKGEITFSKEQHNFLTVQISVNNKMNIIDFAKKLYNALERELKKQSKSYLFLKETWNFIKRLEVAGTSIKNGHSEIDSTVDDFIYSISDTVKKIASGKSLVETGLKKEKDGIVILIDEADSASKDLNIGTFIKNLTEFLVLEDNNKVLFALAGLPSLRDILRDSHESSLRLFEEFKLKPLSKSEVSQVIRKGIEEYNEKYPDDQLQIENGALNDIYLFSEGYPHFVQQIGYSTLQVNDDNLISKEDVEKGVMGKGGAIDLIGDRYYKDLFYDKINVDSYREILIIMAQNWNQWIKKEEIKKNFKGKKSTLDNGLKALKDRNIILTKKGSRGYYRLQWASFAFWIKYYSQFRSNI